MPQHQLGDLVSDIITGTLSVSNDVIADIAGYAALSCYGVVGMDEQLQGADAVRLSANERMRKGVLVKSDEQGLRVDLHVVLENGVNMKSVCENLTSAVAFTLQEIAQIDPAQLTVGIHIEALKNRLS
ncbi:MULTISPECIES: Asp23/Gls24 family envelope stress response protein [Collinsella]|uniref:Asp23/Gls24 family envelope stress response protein n=1 Tax=Collinsella intestinalis TaxID=147207 RepID=UPI000B398BBB|nr:Asp23/Gls24 family envelope stress response protein [Collinsella intestinalis]MBM6906807.1 Asp23/Gls24 family envelope stress response protein [Collinsella intestinalis]MBM6941535.1 Asp23/Gls24 family envelope stress response protein [Collinsella intestinalis]OUO65403.1 Asp23/Gls24 family envelope stress response protein [Collinsella sp. An268]HIU04318.1 Asp23/Gls24 family envelope stress response protein [Candidatus Coprousia avicola]